MAAWVAAGGALLGGLSGVANTLTRTNQQPQQKYDISLAALRDAENNADYQRAISAMVNQRSIAGTQDSFGSSVQYDPATNTWRSVLGPQPTAVQTASDLASISRNTTDLQRAQFANEVAARRAAEAGPAADTARRNLETFRPMGADELVGLMTQQATNASNATFRPLVADTLRSFQRSGTAAGPVLANIGKTQYDALRDSLMDARIKGITGVDQINQGRRQGLEQTAANTATLATPQFQYPGINTATNSNTLANLVAARAQRAGVDPAYGAGGVNDALKTGQSAYNALAGNVPGQAPNTLADAGKEIGKMLSNTDLSDKIGDLFNPATGIGSTSNWEQELLNSPMSKYYDPTGTGTFGSGNQ